MTITWDESGTHVYETGVSKGLLFLTADGGVPWNGLVQVSVDVSGGEAESYYFDGLKYMDRVLAEEFQATISAISTPPEFAACEGLVSPKAGMYRPFGRRQKFHLVWRTEIGSDINESLGYKIHVAYNCTVMPAARNYGTLSDSTTPDVRQFVVKTTPACGPWSYYWFDSRECDLSALEAELVSGNLPSCAVLQDYIAAPGGGETPPTDPDADCLSVLVDLENYNPGQLVSDDIVETGTEQAINGVVNNGLNIVELPASGTFTANDSAATETGTHPVLTDDDDATYVGSADGDLGYTIALPQLVGYVEGATFELHIRMSISGDVNADDPDNLDADAQVHISTDNTGDTTIGGFSDGTDEGMGFALTAVDGTPVDYVVPLYMDSWIDTTLEDVVAALEAGAYLNVVGATNNNFSTTPDVKVYEASVVMLDSTDAGRFLRTDDPDALGSIVQTVTDTNAHTAWVDFKLLEVPFVSGADGDEISVLTWADSTGDSPGRIALKIDGSDPTIKVYDDSDTLLTTLGHGPNAWFTARIDYYWDHSQIRIYKTEDGIPAGLIYDHTITFASTPDIETVVSNYAGMFGDSTHTYEVVVDNARVQMHCHEVRPGPPPGDYELIISPSSVTSEGSTDSRHSPWVVGDTTNGLKDGLDTTYGWVTWLKTVKGVYPLWTTVDVNTHSYEAGDETVLPTSGAPIGFTIDDFDPAWITAIGTRFRAKATESDAIMIPALFGNVSKYLAGKGNIHTPLSFASAGTWENFEYFWTSGEYDTTGWAPLGMQSALAITSYLYTRTWPLNPSDPTLLGDYNIQVSEQYLVIKFTIP